MLGRSSILVFCPHSFSWYQSRFKLLLKARNKIPMAVHTLHSFMLNAGRNWMSLICHLDYFLWFNNSSHIISTSLLSAHSHKFCLFFSTQIWKENESHFWRNKYYVVLKAKITPFSSLAGLLLPFSPHVNIIILILYHDYWIHLVLFIIKYVIYNFITSIKWD